MEVNPSTLLRWLRKYVRLIEEYADKLVPELSGKWHADEMMIKVKGEWQYLWGVMDNETKFLLASEISETRNFENARTVFAKAKTIAKTMPNTIVTGSQRTM